MVFACMVIAVAAQSSVYICDDNFSSSASTPGAGFFGVAPLPDNAGYSVAEDLVHGGPKSVSSFAVDDPWLAETLPMWKTTTRNNRTAPFMTGFSSVRCLGGLANHNKATGTYEPLPEYDAVFRDPTNLSQLVTNFTRVDTTFDGYLASGVEELLVVLDNVPYAFVAPDNQYFGGFGHSGAPDNPEEYALFIGQFVDHLVARYTTAVVSKWRFRLGTECDGPRYGAPWQDSTYQASRANGSTFGIPAGEGLKQYMETYRAVGLVIKQKLPAAAFGPSNMAGIGVSSNMSVTTTQLLHFGEFIRANDLPLDFAAVSEYSRWVGGYGPASLMTDAIGGIQEFAAKATDKKIPLEVHEFGWASWGKFDLPSALPYGAYGGSWNVAAWLWLRHAGASRVFHWQSFFDRTLSRYNRTGTGASLQRTNGYPLVSGWGWAMASMLRMTGCEVQPSTDTVVSSEFVMNMDPAFEATDQPQAPTAAAPSIPKSTFGGFRIARTDTKQLHYLLVSNNPVYNASATICWTLRVEAADFPQGRSFWPLDVAGVAVSASTLDESTAVHNIAKQRLVAAGRATGDNDTSSTSSIDKMADLDGQRWLAADAAEYMEISKQSLLMKPFEGMVRVEDGALVLEGEMQANAMVQLALLRRDTSSP